MQKKYVIQAIDTVPRYFKGFLGSGAGIQSIEWTDRPLLARLLDDETEAEAVIILVLSRIGNTEMRLTPQKIFIKN